MLGVIESVDCQVSSEMMDGCHRIELAVVVCCFSIKNPCGHDLIVDVDIAAARETGRQPSGRPAAAAAAARTAARTGTEAEMGKGEERDAERAGCLGVTCHWRRATVHSTEAKVNTQTHTHTHTVARLCQSTSRDKRHAIVDDASSNSQ